MERLTVGSFIHTLPQVIAHIDLDAFYAQVEQVRLGVSRDTPLAVQQWRGCIAVNYACRAEGIKKHMQLDEIKKLCPEVQLVHVATYCTEQCEECHPDPSSRPPPVPLTTPLLSPEITNFDYASVVPRYHKNPKGSCNKVSLGPYREASGRIFALLRESFGRPRVEKASVDEAYVDLSIVAHEKVKKSGVIALLEKAYREGGGTSLREAADSVGDAAWKAAGNTKMGERAQHCSRKDVGRQQKRWRLALERFCASASASSSASSSASAGLEAGHASEGKWGNGVGVKVEEEEDGKAGQRREREKGREEEGEEMCGETQTEEADASETDVCDLDTLRGVIQEIINDSVLLEASRIVSDFRALLEQRTFYRASAGVAHAKVLAKIGSALNKPNAQTAVRSRMTLAFMRRFPLEKIPLLGGKMGSQMADVAVGPSPSDSLASALGGGEGREVLAGDLWQYSAGELAARTGGDLARAGWVSQRVRGLDSAGVIVDRDLSKSILTAKSFERPVKSLHEMMPWLRVMVGELCARMKEMFEDSGRWPRTLAVGFTAGGAKGEARSKQGELPGECRPSTPLKSLGEKVMREVLKRLMAGMGVPESGVSPQGGHLMCRRVAASVTNFEQVGKSHAAGGGSAAGAPSASVIGRMFRSQKERQQQAVQSEESTGGGGGTCVRKRIESDGVALWSSNGRAVSAELPFAGLFPPSSGGCGVLPPPRIQETAVPRPPVQKERETGRRRNAPAEGEGGGKRPLERKPIVAGAKEKLEKEKDPNPKRARGPMGGVQGERGGRGRGKATGGNSDDFKAPRIEHFFANVARESSVVGPRPNSGLTGQQQSAVFASAQNRGPLINPAVPPPAASSVSEMKRGTDLKSDGEKETATMQNKSSELAVSVQSRPTVFCPECQKDIPADQMASGIHRDFHVALALSKSQSSISSTSLMQKENSTKQFNSGSSQQQTKKKPSGGSIAFSNNPPKTKQQGVLKKGGGLAAFFKKAKQQSHVSPSDVTNQHVSGAPPLTAAFQQGSTEAHDVIDIDDDS
uniref:DNA polymerase eta n=1 Tax=Chromera velia CCMP2878 TaxID=1169474 RepID=A0A0G4HEK0_9ALVE|eukprot:Cvel_26786.t1-p1 / transcript=Cvel_26786.t1 / gene=Cvel_26786 / organism=Chromera_velia_CCMP2878 / gene_product=N-acetyltransferase eso1, putative / transcript_product=N-acetyltransferase eso1, putative / location=Cvel_scaffold3242:4722-10703(-) / protein_length=1032 / sequence_SO=supercontig / SO=protein_coding / is_pseudo=false